MLRLLKIQNLAIIDQATLEIEGGFVCLTGESGAGKSVLIEALLLLGGGRASTSLVRTGCKKAVVEAEFDLCDLPHELELLEGNQLFLRREITQDGRSRAFVNGVMVSAGTLSKYGGLAFEIHGQHGQQRLLKASHHGAMFEEQTGLADKSRAFRVVLDEIRGRHKHYWELKDGAANRHKEMDFIRMQLAEIDDVKPCKNDQDLEHRLKLARNREMICDQQQGLAELLRRHVIPNLDKATKMMGSLQEFMPEMEPYLKEAHTLNTSLAELSAEASYWGEPEHSEPLPELEARETALNRLFLKYGKDLEEVLAERIRLEARLQELSQASTGLDGTWAALATDYAHLRKKRAQLHQAREKAATRFTRKVAANLEELALKGAIFSLSNQWPEWPESLASDRELRLPLAQLQFLFSPNPGEQPRALAQVASGGELSRLLLSLIKALPRNTARLLVFDEIDAGLGGESAHATGASLKELGAAHQVLCVTHFAQVARFADQQIKLEKTVKRGRTFTGMISCNYEQRVSELARLLGGDRHSENLREHARTLLTEPEQL